MSLLRSSSPFDYPILTPLVSLVSLGTSFEVGLIHSWGTLNLTDIHNVNIMKSSVSPKEKRGGIPTTVNQNMLPYMGIEPRQIPILVCVGSMIRRCKDTHTWHAGKYHFMRVM